MRLFNGIVAAALGVSAGLSGAVAAGAPLKWLVVFGTGVVLATAFSLWPEKRRMALALFTVFITVFAAKRLYSSDYPMITGGPSSLGVFLYDLPLLFLGGLFVFRRLFRRDPRVFVPTVLVPWSLYIAWCGLTVLNAVEPVLTMIEIVWFIKMAVMVLVIVNVVEDRRDLLLVISTLVFGLLVQELVTFSQAYSGVWYTFAGDVERTTLQEAGRQEVFRAGGTLGPHNVQGGYYTLLIPLIAAMALVVRRPAAKAALVLVFAGGLVAMFLTYSRNGYVSLAAALAVLAIVARRRGVLSTRQLFQGAWVATFVALCCLLFLGDRLVDRFQSWESTGPRLESIGIALRMTAEHPVLGVGLNNFTLAMAQKAYSPYGISALQQTDFGGQLVGTVVHNKYLLVASETGVVGIVLYLCALVAVLSCIVKLLRREDRLQWGIGAGMMAAAVGASIQMLFDIYNSDLLMTVFWVLVAVAYVSSRISPDEEPQAARAVLAGRSERSGRALARRGFATEAFVTGREEL